MEAINLIAEFVVFFIEFVTWMVIISIVVGLIKGAHSEENVSIDELKAKLVKMIHVVKEETHGDVTYWFDADSDAFLGQGANLKEIIAQVQKRFPTHIFITNEGQKAIKAPAWEPIPIEELTKQ